METWKKSPDDLTNEELAGCLAAFPDPEKALRFLWKSWGEKRDQLSRADYLLFERYLFAFREEYGDRTAPALAMLNVLRPKA